MASLRKFGQIQQHEVKNEREDMVASKQMKGVTHLISYSQISFVSSLFQCFFPSRNNYRETTKMGRG